MRGQRWVIGDWLDNDRPDAAFQHKLPQNGPSKALARFYKAMARFYFHLRDGEFTPDEEGVELFDETAAREFALKNARSIMAHKTTAGRVPLKGCIEIEDADHRPVMVVPFAAAVDLD